MSKINVLGTINDISVKTTVYSPIIEAIVNAIHAIKMKENVCGVIEIVFIRDIQTNNDGSLPAVKSVQVVDNGVGMHTKEHLMFRATGL